MTGFCSGIMRVLILSLLLIVIFPGFAADIYPFRSTAKQHQFEQLTEQLRCLVCQNASIAESNASLAKDLRDQVYRMVMRGKTDAEIKHYLVQRYGDFVLFKPPMESRTYFLWIMPVVLLIFGFWIVLRVIKKRACP